MFADALERAVNSKEQSASDMPEDSWEEHPYFDGLDHEEDAAVPNDEHDEVPWEEHPFYDDLVSSETDRGDDDDLDRSQDTSTHAVDQQESDDDVPDDAQEVAWEDHPYYDTPDETLLDVDLDAKEEDSNCSSSLMDGDLDEEDEIPFEDHPYY